MERILNVFMRGILGTIAIYFINSMLEGMGISLGVGVNIFTALTSGILGIPGVLVLYAILKWAGAFAIIHIQSADGPE